MSSPVKRLSVALLVATAMVVILPAAASAHTALLSSSPADGELVDGPLDRVTLVFQGTPTVIDGGIAVADSAGAEFEPQSVVQNDLEIVATFDPPLTAGAYALAWRVRSDDTHFIDGSFSFTVDASAGPTTTVPSAAAPATTAPATTAPATTAPATTAPATTAPELQEAVAPQPTTSTAGDPLVEDAADVTGQDDDSAVPLAPDLGGGIDTEDGKGVARIGRLVLFPSAVVAIGLLAFAALAFAGRRAELGVLIRGVRWMGVGVILGGIIQVVGLSKLLGGFSEVLGDGVGRAAAARVVAGVLIVAGFAAIPGTTRPRLGDATHRSARDQEDRAARRRSLSAAVVDDPLADSAVQNAGGSEGARWSPTSFDSLGLVGVVILVVSFAFDGHTVSRGPRVLHGLTSVLHVAGAGIWAGGLVALATVLWFRRRARVESSALGMIVRFSVVAMGALAVTGGAGLAMALFIDSDVLGYVSTDWGRLMIVKTALVGLAALIGAYNHFRILPALERAPDDELVVTRARSTVTAEATLVVLAAIVTALLVAASTIG